MSRNPLLFLALFVLLALPPPTRAAEVSCEADGTCTAVDTEAASSSAGATAEPDDGDAGDDDAVEIDDPCVDLNPNCAKWANEGECRRNPGFMLASCARACDVCPAMDPLQVEREAVVANPECEDLHEMCRKWAGEGECVINHKYMQKACRDSCMLCLNLPSSRRRGDSEDYIRRKRIFMNLDTGKPQEVPSDIDEDEKHRTKSLLRGMDEYAKGYLLDEDTPDVVRERCKNSFGLCAHWATRGMCADRVVYMLNSCPLACRACDRTEEFHRCAGRRHPEERPAFEGGGIDRMFREIKGGGWDGRGPEFVTEPEPDGGADDPYIVRFDRFLTDEEADRLVRIGDEIGWVPSAIDEAEFGAGNPGRDAPRRTSASAVCGAGEPCEEDPVYRAVLDRISSVVGVSTRNFEAVELVRYGPRDSYGVHHDYRIHDNWKPAGPRALTFLLVLTDVEEGGATGFPDLDWLFIKPKKGQALLWSNVLSDDPTEADRRLVHEGLPVVKGQKHVANVWIHQYDWRKALERDCV